MQTKILFINPPVVGLENGGQLTLGEIQGSPRVVATIDTETKRIVSNNIDPDCVGGVCPIK